MPASQAWGLFLVVDGLGCYETIGTYPFLLPSLLILPYITFPVPCQCTVKLRLEKIRHPVALFTAFILGREEQGAAYENR